MEQAKRLSQLDALRGLAAFVVVLHHIRYSFHEYPAKWVVLPIFSGESAVVLFFVLSGYVLSLPYWNGKAVPYMPFLARRLCRIYLPFLGALAISLLGAWHFMGRTPTGTTAWFRSTWHAPLTPKLLLSQLLIWPSPEVNTALWSLRYELQISAVMPILCLLLRRWNALMVTFLAALLMFGKMSFLNAHDWHHIIFTLRVSVDFMVGASLAYYRKGVSAFFKRIGHASWLVLAGALTSYYVLSARLIERYPHSLAFGMIGNRAEFITSLGAAGIIACALHMQHVSRMLEHSIFQYLGRISFSLYVLQGTIIFACLDAFSGKLPAPVLFASIAVLSIGAAHIFYYVVEDPCIHLSKRVAEYTAGISARHSSGA